MQLTINALALLAATSAALAGPNPMSVKVTFDQTYDNPSYSLSNVACSNGDNGLNPPYAQFGDLPGFPYIGGSSFVEAWNSPNCGSCWKLTYKGTSIYVTLVDSYYQGFNIAKQAMDVLTDNNSDDGPVQIVATQAPKAYCGF